jgi:hypothetical protein
VSGKSGYLGREIVACIRIWAEMDWGAESGYLGGDILYVRADLGLGEEVVEMGWGRTLQSLGSGS